jgi:broad specificity phosphatase PhoE
MGRVIFVRHGQASLGSDDYDRLSPRGVEQGERLGAHWQRDGRRFVAVLRGSLRRHRQTLDAITRSLDGLPAAQEHTGLNEYDGDALIRALGRGPLAPPRDAQQVKAHFRLLREALLQWMDGALAPEGMPGFVAFREGVAGALAAARKEAANGDVLIVSSGGPISVAAAMVLDAPSSTAVALNMRLANSALVELASTATGFELEAFNHLPHLAGAPQLMTRA